MSAIGHLWPLMSILCFVIPSVLSVINTGNDKDVLSKNIGQMLDYKANPVKGKLFQA